MAQALPTYFISHGGGPLPLLNDASHAPIIAHWKQLAATITAPKSILVVSAHWEEKEVTITSAEKPDLLYDYYGFPPESYEIKYPAPGNPALVSRIGELLGAAGIPHKSDPKRGLDHGVFVPLKLIFPKADIPVVQLSLLSSLNPEKHIAIGRALAPLCSEGVLIIGSGFSFHNMRAFFGGGDTALGWSKAFNSYLVDVSKKVGAERDRLLSAWSSAPHAKDCHPREEHLIPLLVVASAASEEPGHVIYKEKVLGVEAVDLRFGEQTC